MNRTQSLDQYQTSSRLTSILRLSARSLEIAALKFVFRHRTLGIRSSTTRSGVGATSRENAIALELHLALPKTLTK